MGRIELNNRFAGVTELQELCNKAKKDRFDAVFVPPMFVSTAAEMLGRNDISIVTTAGRDDDTLQTKLMGIESAARAGAQEVIVCVSQHNIFDEKWDLLSKELFQLAQMAEIHRVFLWLGCQFSMLDRQKQATIASRSHLMKIGLRVRGATPDDIRFAKICGVKNFCVGYREEDLDLTEIQERINAGADQFSLNDKPPQLKTTDLKRTEVSL